MKDVMPQPQPGSRKQRPALARASGKQALRRALIVLGGPLLRLHHYRDVRTKLLHDALSARECGIPGQPGSDPVRTVSS